MQLTGMTPFGPMKPLHELGKTKQPIFMGNPQQSQPAEQIKQPQKGWIA